MNARGYRPWELDRLTLAEVCLLMEDETKVRPPRGRKALGAEEVHAYAARVRGLTALQKLRAVRAGEL